MKELCKNLIKDLIIIEIREAHSIKALHHLKVINKIIEYLEENKEK